MAAQSTGRIVLLSAWCGIGRAIQIFVLETCEIPPIARTALMTVSLPVQGMVRTLSPRPAPSVTM